MARTRQHRGIPEDEAEKGENIINITPEKDREKRLRKHFGVPVTPTKRFKRFEGLETEDANLRIMFIPLNHSEIEEFLYTKMSKERIFPDDVVVFLESRHKEILENKEEEEEEEEGKGKEREASGKGKEDLGKKGKGKEEVRKFEERKFLDPVGMVENIDFVYEENVNYSYRATGFITTFLCMWELLRRLEEDKKLTKPQKNVLLVSIAKMSRSHGTSQIMAMKEDLLKRTEKDVNEDEFWSTVQEEVDQKWFKYHAYRIIAGQGLEVFWSLIHIDILDPRTGKRVAHNYIPTLSRKITQKKAKATDIKNTIDKALDLDDKPTNLLKAIRDKLEEYKKSLEADDDESKFELNTQNYLRVAYTHINNEFKNIVHTDEHLAGMRDEDKPAERYNILAKNTFIEYFRIMLVVFLENLFAVKPMKLEEALGQTVILYCPRLFGAVEFVSTSYTQMPSILKQKVVGISRGNKIRIERILYYLEIYIVPLMIIVQMSWDIQKGKRMTKENKRSNAGHYLDYLDNNHIERLKKIRKDEITSVKNDDHTLHLLDQLYSLEKGQSISMRKVKLYLIYDQLMAFQKIPVEEIAEEDGQMWKVHVRPTLEYIVALSRTFLELFMEDNFAKEFLNVKGIFDIVEKLRVYELHGIDFINTLTNVLTIYYDVLDTTLRDASSLQSTLTLAKRKNTRNVIMFVGTAHVFNIIELVWKNHRNDWELFPNDFNNILKRFKDWEGNREEIKKIVGRYNELFDIENEVDYYEKVKDQIKQFFFTPTKRTPTKPNPPITPEKEDRAPEEEEALGKEERPEPLEFTKMVETEPSTGKFFPNLRKARESNEVVVLYF